MAKELMILSGLEHLFRATFPHFEGLLWECSIFLNGCSMLMSQSMISFQNSALQVYIRRRTFSGPQDSEFCEDMVFLIQEPELELTQNFGAGINVATRHSFPGLIPSLPLNKPRLYSLLSHEEDSSITARYDQASRTDAIEEPGPGVG
jgi:hypothetical protein